MPEPARTAAAPGPSVARSVSGQPA